MEGIELLRAVIENRMQRVSDDIEYRPTDKMVSHWAGEQETK